MVSEDDGPNREPDPDRTRALLVACCLLAIALVGLLVPTLTGGVVDSPAESMVPGDAVHSKAAENLGDLAEAGLGDINASNIEGSNAEFSALNPPDSAPIGSAAAASAALDSQSTAVHFTVQSSSPAYWRTGAYDEYTGSSWKRSGDVEDYDGSIDGDGMEGPRVEYQVELNRSASTLPTVWRPAIVRGVSGLEVTDKRAVRTDNRLGPGSTYSGVSYKPPQDPSVLQASGRDYPASVEQQYTSLPSDTPPRVRRFTDELTADADSPYETAVTIEQWLEENKSYSLEVSTTSGHMADTFIFEMDRGYCEYFATAMTAMLRSQDIPARYVVGYSTGQPIGENTYQVRGMNAHAWVEVYFEDVGWVKFDPTPGNERLQRERESVQEENPDIDYNPTEQGSPGEEFSPSENETDSNTQNETDSTVAPPSGETDSGYMVTLNRTAVPGMTVEVTVTRDGSPATGVTVLFNGDPIGQTDDDGTVTGTVPYDETLEIGIDDSTTASLAPPGAIPQGTDGRFYDAPEPTANVVPARGNFTVPVETNVSVLVTGVTIPGSNVTVTAMVGDHPFRDATVLVDGEAVGTTNENGRAAIPLPDRGGNVTVAVERESVRGETTVTLPELSVTVTPTAPLALPYTTAVVNVTAGGDPVGAAPVYVDGEQVATTDVNGTATITLPAADSATVRVEGAGLSETTTVSGLLVNLVLAVVAVLAVVGAILGVAHKRGYAPREVLEFVRDLPGLLVQYSQWALVTLATRWDELLAMAVTRTRLTVEHVRTLVRGESTPEELYAALRSWLADKRGTDEAVDVPSGAGVAEQRRSVRQAWRQFLQYVSLRPVRTKTPGEIARYAVDSDGLPERPVSVLRDTFREVEYGARSAEERLDRVEQAVRRIETEVGDEDDSDGGDS